MNQANVPTKKSWVAPSVTVIDLRTARHGATSTVNDFSTNRRS